jgi:hypothetical protein
MFEFSEEVIKGCQKNLDQIKLDTAGIRKVWAHIKVCED